MSDDGSSAWDSDKSICYIHPSSEITDSYGPIAVFMFALSVGGTIFHFQVIDYSQYAYKFAYFILA